MDSKNPGFELNSSHHVFATLGNGAIVEIIIRYDTLDVLALKHDSISTFKMADNAYGVKVEYIEK